MPAESKQDKPIALADLKPGEKLEGQISRIEVYGAFVDVGAEHEGMIHISKLGTGRVTRVQDVVSIGDRVDVWVERVDPAAERLELTLVRPTALRWESIKPGLTLEGKVIRIEKFGAFVELGAERPGLVHISEMGAGYIGDPAELVDVGDEVQVTVLEIDRRRKRIKLSMKAGYETLDEAEDEPVPTAMELALKQAMQSADIKPAPKQAELTNEADKQRQQLDDLLARTLSSRMKTSSEEQEGN